jgi:hypothetical protein
VGDQRRLLVNPAENNKQILAEVVKKANERIEQLKLINRHTEAEFINSKLLELHANKIDVDVMNQLLNATAGAASRRNSSSLAKVLVIFAIIALVIFSASGTIKTFFDGEAEKMHQPSIQIVPPSNNK